MSDARKQLDDAARLFLNEIWQEEGIEGIERLLLSSGCMCPECGAKGICTNDPQVRPGGHERLEDGTIISRSECLACGNKWERVLA